MRHHLACLIVSASFVIGCDDSKPAATTTQNPAPSPAGVGATGSHATSGGGRSATTNESTGSPGGGATNTGTGGGTSGGDPTNRP
ncbi:MAG: hypothetical protein JWM57_951 [Phycisphaerales bacterium]|nr:hypothetical protein [Phycisphaerales bacterium]